jgi:hypothetical protein
LKINNENFIPYAHNTLCKLLGLVCSETDIRKTEICPKNPQFLPHQEYRIYCNIIDSSQKLVNGEESK